MHKKPLFVLILLAALALIISSLTSKPTPEQLEAARGSLNQKQEAAK